jgi:hypothetical protein
MMAKPTTNTILLSLSEELGMDVRWPRKGVEETQLGENVFQDENQVLQHDEDPIEPRVINQDDNAKDNQDLTLESRNIVSEKVPLLP